MEDLNIHGRYITVTSVDPNDCYFLAKYPDGSIRKGNNLYDTGWDNIPNGLTELTYVLSTGHVITFPRFKAYLPLIECSVGLDGSRVFHAINVKCLEENSVVVWRVLLKQDTTSNMKIGDIILSREPLPKIMSSSWKFTS
jgi:hypothetical protein